MRFIALSSLLFTTQNLFFEFLIQVICKEYEIWITSWLVRLIFYRRTEQIQRVRNKCETTVRQYSNLLTCRSERSVRQENGRLVRDRWRQSLRYRQDIVTQREYIQTSSQKALLEIVQKLQKNQRTPESGFRHQEEGK